MQTTKRMLIVVSWVLVLSLVALTAATYAWMSIATSYKASDLDLFIITENAMEIAPDVDGQPGEWSKSLSLAELSAVSSELRPVTWSAKDRAFYAPKYGTDGRIDFMDKHLVTSVSSDIPTPADEAEEEGAGYLIAVDFWLRTGAAKVSTYLSKPDVVEDERVGNGTYVVGEAVWDENLEHHVSAGNGAENVIRVGFLTYDYLYPDGTVYENASFCIYEPNTTEDEQTMGIDKLPLEGDGKLIKQSDSYFTEQEDILSGFVNYEMGEFISEDTEMFGLLSNAPRKITLFVWLEGQDAQCNNSISAGKILANLQIGATTKNNQQGIGRPEGGGEE